MRTSPSPRSLVNALAVAALLPTTALAQTSPPDPPPTPPTPDYTLTANAGAYYTAGTAPKKAFYTDLTGYNTAKDVGVVYVKKTF